MAEHGGADRSSKPLQGAILCCTSILPDQRSVLASVAAQMGAQHKLDLTSDVTHLIVGEPNTPKYKYVAKERQDVKVVRPAWVQAVREAWMQAEEVDVQALDEQFKVPTLAGLHVCLTGYDDLTFRARLQEEIIGNGGVYNGDLTRGATHLIARVPAGKKYEHASQWPDTRVVGLKWLKDSLERGMALEETLYDVRTPVQEQGIGAWNPDPKPPVQLGKRNREDESATGNARKLRRTASAKLGSQNAGIWTDIVDGFEPTVSNRAELEGRVRGAKSVPNLKPVVLEAKSFASDTTEGHRGVSKVTEQQEASHGDQMPAKRGLLDGACFCLHAFSTKETAILQKHIASNDGEIIEDWREKAQETSSGPFYLVVAYTTRAADLPDLHGYSHPPFIVTTLFVERWLFMKLLKAPSDHAVSTPFPAFPIPGFGSMVVNSTGFAGIEVPHVSKSVVQLGAIYNEFLQSNVSVLVCQPAGASAAKIRLAYEWSIPIVSQEWLWDCVRSGKKQPFERYLVPTSKTMKLEVQQARREADERARLENEASNDIDMARRKEHAKNRSIEVARQASRNCVDDSRTTNTVSKDPAKPHPARRSTIQPAPETNCPTPKSPLQEISTNSPPKQPSPAQTTKKSLFQRYETNKPSVPTPEHNNSCSAQPPAPEPTSTNKTTYAPPGPDSLTDAIKEALAKQKARSKSSSDPSTMVNAGRSTARRRGLLGRASSNMSNSSREGSVAGGIKPSRASSVDTMNEDGAGSIILGEDHTSQQMKHIRTGSSGSVVLGGAAGSGPNPHNNRNGSFTARATTSMTISNGLRTEPLYKPNDGATDQDLEMQMQQGEQPAMTQIAYEDDEATLKLRAEMNRNYESKSGIVVPFDEKKEKLRRVIQDDEAFVAVRRTMRKRT